MIALTGGMLGPPETTLTVAGSFDGTPVYFGTGDPDDWVPVWRVRETAAAYGAAAADVTLEIFPGRAHEIGGPELDQTRARSRRWRRTTVATKSTRTSRSHQPLTPARRSRRRAAGPC